MVRKIFIAMAYSGAIIAALMIILGRRYGITMHGHYEDLNLLGMLGYAAGAPARLLFPGDTFDDFIPTAALLAGLFWLFAFRLFAWVLDLAMGEEHG